MTPTLHWKRVPGADYYNIWVEKLGTEAWEVVFGPQYASGESFIVPAKILEPGGSYFWFAVAQGKDVKNTATSKVAYFRT